jgi:hypothetical protein
MSALNAYGDNAARVSTRGPKSDLKILSTTTIRRPSHPAASVPPSLTSPHSVVAASCPCPQRSRLTPLPSAQPPVLDGRSDAASASDTAPAMLQ